MSYSNIIIFGYNTIIDVLSFDVFTLDFLQSYIFPIFYIILYVYTYTYIAYIFIENCKNLIFYTNTTINNPMS